ncbi:RloB family protein [Roseibacillus ishigakijimensis]|uniref:RloB domain-containing protein n=1 Tax=Roseibacillus ishigakijimensis TaxID=454146 RepID=A0A934RSE2_9BACT|nr:RloB family protein [Roseibacillus ishigakijimensis]MBK1835062.1 RloB domain-containing protein [Roseibacillus ishigakijimensis]
MPKRQKKSWERTRDKRSRKQNLRRFLIVCEDEKSSRLYLQKFPFDRKLVEIETVGGCGNTISVVERGLELKDRAQKKKQPYVHVYCVIDRDEHPLDRYRAAFSKGYKHNDVSIIWANEAFELWYLLHYDYLDTPTHRDDLARRFAEKMGRSYDKADDSIFEELESKLSTAFQNAERLEKQLSGEREPQMANPSTNIHDLVKRLLDIGNISQDD